MKKNNIYTNRLLKKLILLKSIKIFLIYLHMLKIYYIFALNLKSGSKNR